MQAVIACTADQDVVKPVYTGCVKIIIARTAGELETFHAVVINDLRLACAVDGEIRAVSISTPAFIEAANVCGGSTPIHDEGVCAVVCPEDVMPGGSQINSKGVVSF